ncbi:hypothetical protein [Paenibacillus ferrarius]|uniref:hypothetical protein n=1 Tax=Paenibacillus ferrarius TaxID=1469647 RepID=UPI001301DA9F|nr:hypothetical protein [Paenibacillus ferrarius]
MQFFSTESHEKAEKPAIMQAFPAISSYIPEIASKACRIAGILRFWLLQQEKGCIIAGF